MRDQVAGMKVARPTAKGSSESVPRAGKPRITVGLVNNMPDEALRATERQFESLLYAASDAADVRLLMFALGKTSRSPATQRHLSMRYEPAPIANYKLDGLIITGAAPRAPHLEGEPYWQELTEVIDWAKSNTVSTIFSCLAAHAGVWHLDRVKRRKLPEKHVGLFAFAADRDHPFVGRRGRRLLIPHSRYNGLLRCDLEQAGYDVLTSSPLYGVDAFTKSFSSLFVFLQGHLEYESNSLAREYRRDLRQYWLGETNAAPLLPKAYFSPDGEDQLLALSRLARVELGELEEKLSIIDTLAPLRAPWESDAAHFYRGWITAIVCATEKRVGAASPIGVTALA